MANRTFPELPELTEIDAETLVAVDSGTQTFKTKGSTLKGFFTDEIVSRLDTFVDPQIEKFNDVIRSQFCSSFTKNTVDTTLPRSISKIAYSPKDNLLVAACQFNGSSGNLNRYLLASQDLGLSWFSINYTAVPKRWSSICYSPELELFVAVSDVTGNNQQVLSSPDGINWTIRLSPSTTVSWQDVTWSPELELFCAVGAQSGGTQKIMTSEDGFAWTARTEAGPAVNDFACIEWSSALGLFVAAGNKLNTSPDGINWTNRTITSEFIDLAWSPELGLFCGAVFIGASLARSTDGINWTFYNPFPGQAAASIVWCDKPKIFVAMVYSGNKFNIAYSKDAINWKLLKMPNFDFKVVANYHLDRIILGANTNADPTTTGLFSIGPQLPEAL